MIYYIAGRMSNMPEHNFPAFNEAERLLNAAGYETVNPVHHADGVGTNMPYDYYIRESILDIMRVDGVAVLPEWWLSTGATLEVHIAKVLGLPIYTVDDLLTAVVTGIAPEKLRVSVQLRVPNGQLVG